MIDNRTLEILDNLLGHDFKGTVMSDGYLAYRHFINRLHCWAHLLRKTQGLIDSADARVAAIGQAMHESFCNLMESILTVIPVGE